MDQSTIDEVNKAVFEEETNWPWYVKFATYLWDSFVNLPDTLQEKFFEYKNGYKRSDVFSLNRYIIEKLYSPLKDFIAHYETHGMSLPMEFATDPGTWLMILKKIEYAFDAEYEKICGEDDMIYGLNKKQLEEHDEKVQEGFELFGKYLRDLWD